MKIVYNHTATRLITLIIALQILNMSIDAPCAQMQFYKTNSQNFNYIDTYVEFFAEVVLNHENAIPETKNRPHKELLQHHHLTIIFQITKHAAPALEFEPLSNEQRMHYDDKYAYQFIKEINPPPPKLS